MPVVPKICPLMQRDYCQRENCAIWHHDRCGLIVDGVFIAQSIMGHTISQEILGEIPAKLDDLAEAIKGQRRTVIYWTCPCCGANLDPGERCDCKTKSRPECCSTHRRRAVNSFCTAVIPPLAYQIRRKSTMDYTKIVKVLSLAATGNSIDAALDEMSKKELEYLLELCEEEKARRQAAKNGGACNDG